ncbi:MAG TPA: tetratricopeptide repeat protein, partial [Bacteroidota bacterium]|nr:tetratricopeptide repeat protein [Bacteroidota bacterium]
AWEDADAILSLAPHHPMVSMWRAYVASNMGRGPEARELLRTALEESPLLVFPHRTEEMDLLRWAEREQPHWKIRYYIGLLSRSLGKQEEAERWLDACGDVPDFAPFYLTRASLRTHDAERALEDYRKALRADPGAWRTHDALITFLNERGRFAEALPLCVDAAGRFPGSYIMQFLLARTLLFNKEYASSLAILDTLRILPFEGARYGRDAYRQACILTALRSMQQPDHGPALSLIARARLWPERLGAGEPYDADTRIEDYLEALLFRGSRDAKARGDLLEKVAAYTVAHRGTGNTQHLIGAYALRELGRKAEALDLLQRWAAREPGSAGARWSLLMFQGKLRDARNLEETLRPSLLNRSNGDQDFVLMADVAGFLGQGR